MKNIVKHLAAFALLAITTIGYNQNTKKLISGKWKMTHTFENGSEVKPKHEQLVLIFTKKNEFTITAAFEETHKGTYKIDESAQTITIKDKWSKEEKVFGIRELTKNHVILDGYDGEGTSIECVPLSNSKAKHLSHKETLLAKRWTIYKSDKPHNLDMVFEFKHDHTFIAIPYGHKIPVAQGEWKMSNDHKKVLLDMTDDGEHLELDIETLHKHEMVLINPTSETTNYFHDEKLTSKDPEVQARIQKGRKEMIQSLENETPATDETEEVEETEE